MVNNEAKRSYENPSDKKAKVNNKGENKGGLRNRTSPKCLNEVVSKLNDSQKDAVRKMGLECLLDMSINGVTAKLGYFIVDNLDPACMQIRLGHGVIDITPEAVHHVIGVQMGGIDIAAQTIGERNVSLINVWKGEFGNKYVTQKRLMEVIVGSNDAGLMFKVYFLVLFVNIMCECSRDGTCNVKFLERIRDIDMVKEINWTKYICNCVARSKKTWRRESYDSFYCGPITFLLVLLILY